MRYTVEMSTIYDTAIIGAGICGCSVAHFLTQNGEKVALIDKAGIAAGGSGAAGAFISPKFTKSGPLKALMEEAYLYALSFYAEICPELIRIAPLIHFAKYSDENEKVAAFKASTALPLLPGLPDAPLRPEALAFEHTVLKESGLISAKAACSRLAKNATLVKEDINIIKYESGLWRVGSMQARKIVLATGAYRPVVAMPHIVLRPVWGHRIDIRTKTPLLCHLHQYVSIAATDDKGCSAIGATHDVHYHPETSKTPYDIEAGRAELLEKASRTVTLDAVEITADYTGLRSGSNDYFPIVGAVADAEASLLRCPELKKGVKTSASDLAMYPNLYMINGTGGYGFVLGPYLGKLLSNAMLGTTPMPETLEPTRFLYRWAKKK